MGLPPTSKASLLYKEGLGTAVVYCLLLHSLVFIFLILAIVLPACDPGLLDSHEVKDRSYLFLEDIQVVKVGRPGTKSPLNWVATYDRTAGVPKHPAAVQPTRQLQGRLLAPSLY